MASQTDEKPDTIMRRADAALYQAKRKRRNQVMVEQADSEGAMRT